VKVWTLVTVLLTWVRPAALYKLRTGSWLAWAMHSALCGHPLPALMDNGTHGTASRRIIAPINHTRPSPCSSQQVSYYSFAVLLRVGGWVSLSTQYVSNLLKVACSRPGESRTCNLSYESDTLTLDQVHPQSGARHSRPAHVLLRVLPQGELLDPKATADLFWNFHSDSCNQFPVE